MNMYAMKGDDMDYRSIYENVWTHKGYRHYSPAEQIKDVLEGAFLPHSRIIDFGCGTGRMAQRLQDKGHQVIGIDVATNCLDSDVNIPFLRCNLTKVPPTMLTTDYGYCVDVLEHLIPEDVPHVVNMMKNSIAHRLYIRVANFKETHGPAYVGEQLHLTLWNLEQWRECLKSVWCKQADPSISTSGVNRVSYIPLKADVSPERYTFLLEH